MNLTSSLSLAGLITLVFMVINFLKYLTNLKTHGNEALTQVIVWVAGVLVVLLAAHAQITKGIVIFGGPLRSLDAGSIVIAGLMIGSGASAGNQLLGALDSTRSSATPTLVPSGPTD